MRIFRFSQARWWLPALCLFLGWLALAGVDTTVASAAPGATYAHPRGPARSLVGCAPCISDISPANGSTVTPDATGKVMISATAQLNTSYTKFTFTVDKVDVDPTQVQVAGAPTAPTATVSLPLTAGAHRVFAQVFDATGPQASFGWDFTSQAAPTPSVTATPTRTTAGTGTGDTNGGGTSPIAAKSGITLNSVSLIFFAVAVVGLLVVAFIAGMWYGGRRLPSS